MKTLQIHAFTNLPIFTANSCKKHDKRTLGAYLHAAQQWSCGKLWVVCLQSEFKLDHEAIWAETGHRTHVIFTHNVVMADDEDDDWLAHVSIAALLSPFVLLKLSCWLLNKRRWPQIFVFWRNFCSII